MTDVPLPEPALFAHELILNGGDVWLGCPKRGICEQAHVEGETGEEVREFYTADQLRSYGEACAQAERERAIAAVRGLDCAHRCGIGWEIEQAIRAGLDAPSHARSDLGVPAAPSGSSLQPPSSASAAIPIAAGRDLRDGDPVDDVIPTLPAGHVWCCGNGCGDCRAILVQFEYSRTETVDGELLESRSVMRAASHCCKAPLMIWDEVNDTEGPEPDFRAPKNDQAQSKTAGKL